MFVSRTGLEMTHIIEKMYSLARLISPLPNRRLQSHQVSMNLKGTDTKKDTKIFSSIPANSQVDITNMYINMIGDTETSLTSIGNLTIYHQGRSDNTAIFLTIG